MFIKDPDSNLDYRFDWSGWLAAGETIFTSAWMVDNDTLLLESDQIVDDSTIIWLSGGTAGIRYQVTNRITTSAGRIDDRSFAVKIAER